MHIEYKILLIASLLSNFGDNLIGPFYAVFVERIGGSVLEIGYSAAIFSLSSGLLIIVVGRASDRLNKEGVTVLGYFLYALGSLGYLLISSPWQLFALQIIFALGTACLAAPLSALFARFIQRDKEGLQWALQGGGDRMVIGLAVLAGTLLVHGFGFRVLFLIMVVIQAAASAAQLFAYRKISHGKGL